MRSAGPRAVPPARLNECTQKKKTIEDGMHTALAQALHNVNQLRLRILDRRLEFVGEGLSGVKEVVGLVELITRNNHRRSTRHIDGNIAREGD